jgi:hypothetical protein
MNFRQECRTYPIFVGPTLLADIPREGRAASPKSRNLSGRRYFATAPGLIMMSIRPVNGSIPSRQHSRPDIERSNVPPFSKDQSP